MWTQRIISHFLFSIMLLVQAHAAIPHQHLGTSGSCGAVCHAHGSAESWWDAVVDEVHDLVHRHAETAACESDEEVFRPASELEFEAVEATLPPAIGFVAVHLAAAAFHHEEVLRTQEPLEVRSLRGPPSRG